MICLKSVREASRPLMGKPITELVSKQDSRDELINKFNILIRDINKSLDTNDDW